MILWHCRGNYNIKLDVILNGTKCFPVMLICSIFVFFFFYSNSYCTFLQKSKAHCKNLPLATFSLTLHKHTDASNAKQFSANMTVKKQSLFPSFYSHKLELQGNIIDLKKIVTIVYDLLRDTF